jgi:GNAT superfamily N-acetyltransferase
VLRRATRDLQFAPAVAFTLRALYDNFTMGFEIRCAVIGDESRLRAVRLAALEDSMHLFDTSIERELAYSTDDWRRWITGSAVFFLESGGEARGLACGKRDASDPQTVHLLAMWVHPDLRGSGAADVLIAAVKDWATEIGAARVRLGLVEGNMRAQRCYERAGFRLTGGRSRVQFNPLPEIEMICELRERRDS